MISNSNIRGLSKFGYFLVSKNAYLESLVIPKSKVVGDVEYGIEKKNKVFVKECDILIFRTGDIMSSISILKCENSWIREEPLYKVPMTFVQFMDWRNAIDSSLLVKFAGLEKLEQPNDSVTYLKDEEERLNEIINLANKMQNKYSGFSIKTAQYVDGLLAIVGTHVIFSINIKELHTVNIGVGNITKAFKFDEYANINKMLEAIDKFVENPKGGVGLFGLFGSKFKAGK